MKNKQNLNKFWKITALVGLINGFFMGLSCNYNTPYLIVSFFNCIHDNNQQDMNPSQFNDVFQSDQSWGFPATSDAYHYFTTFNTAFRNNAIDIALVQNIPSISLDRLFCQSNDQDLFTNYHLYACENYLNYIRGRPGYENFILELYEKIHRDHHFRKSLRSMAGFHGKNGFSDFIGNEVKKINDEKESRSIRLQEEEDRKKIEFEKTFELKRLQENQPRLYGANCTGFEQVQASNVDCADQKLVNRYKQRSYALKKMSENGGTCSDYSSRVKHPTFTDEYAEVFNNCYGTALDEQLHEELCATRTTMIQLQANHPDLIQVKTISPIVYHFTALAKVQTNPDVAFNLSDFCYYLTKAVQEFGNAAQTIMHGVGKGTINLVEQNVTFCKALVTHPIDDIVKPLCKAGVALGKALYHATEFAINDPEKFNRKVVDIATSVSQYVYDKPEEAIAGVVELLIPFNLPTLVKLKSVQSIISAVREQEQFSQVVQLTSNVAMKITAPIKKLLVDANALVSVGIQHGKVAMQNLIKVAEQQPEITSVGDIAALKMPTEWFNDFEKLSNEVTRKSDGITIAENFESFAGTQCSNVGADLQKAQPTQGAKMAEQGVGVGVEKKTETCYNKGRNAANDRGKKFEESLVKKLGGKGSFKVTDSLDGTREFDGAIGNVWYEAKSGQYWNMLLSNNEKLSKFKQAMLRGLRIASKNGASYELYSEMSIPQDIKNWLTENNIKFKEWL